MFGEDIQFEIETSSRKHTDTRIDNENCHWNGNDNRNDTGTEGNQSQSYIEQLETKIQAQANRLSALENYKYLAEKRVKQLSPNEAFPLSEQSTKSKGDNNKYDSLNAKYIKLQNDFNELASKKGIESSNKNTLGSNLSSESNSNSNTIAANNSKANVNSTVKKLKDAYNHLKQKYKEVIAEKKEAFEQLRQETLHVEEQRNIIAILKQTLDSEFIKSGVFNNKNITAGSIIDFTQIKSESEQYRKQLVLSQALVNSLKSEIEEMIKEKDQTVKGAKELQETNRGLIEKASNTERDLNEKLMQYQSDIGSITKDLEAINTKLYDQVNSYPPSTTKRETEPNLINAHNAYNVHTAYNTIKDLKSKMEDLLSLYHRLCSEHTVSLNEITKLKEENLSLIAQLSNLQQSKEASEQSIEDCNQIKEVVQSQQKQIAVLTKKNNELLELIEEADSKLTENYSLNKDINLRFNALESELNRKKEQLMHFNDLQNKMDYFTQYVNAIKAAFKLLINQASQYSQQYNSMANENLNSLLTKNFSQAITLIINQLNNLPKINQNTLDSTDAAITKTIVALMQIVTEEFQTIYSKLFESNQYFKESHTKVGLLEGQLRQETNTLRKDNMSLQKRLQSESLRCDEIRKQLDQCEKDIEAKDKCVINQEAQIRDMKLYSNSLNNKINSVSNDKTRLCNILHILTKHIQSKDTQKVIMEFLSINETVSKLSIEQAHVDEKLASMKEEYEKMVRLHGIDSDNKELIDIVNKEQRTLQELAYEFHQKIAEKDKRLNEILSILSNHSSGIGAGLERKPMHYQIDNNPLESNNAFVTINQEGMGYTTPKALNGNNYSNDAQLTDYEDFEMDTIKIKNNSTADMTNASGNKSIKDAKYTYEFNK